MRGKILRFWMGLAIGGLIGIITYLVNSQEVTDLTRRISDSCFCAGLTCLCLGGLMFARNKGSFDILAYGLGAAFRLHVPGADMNPRKDADYVAYRARKAAHRNGPGPMLLAGLVYLAASTAALALYYR